MSTPRSVAAFRRAADRTQALNPSNETSAKQGSSLLSKNFSYPTAGQSNEQAAADIVYDLGPTVRVVNIGNLPIAVVSLALAGKLTSPLF